MGSEPIVIQDASGAQKDCNGAGISEGGMAYTLNGRERQAVYHCHGTNVGEMGTLRAGNGHATGGVPFLAQRVTASKGKTTDAAGSHGADPLNLVTHVLTAEGHDASEDGTGRGRPLVPTACPVSDVSTPLTANDGKQPDNSDTSLGPNLVVAHGVRLRGREGGATAELREEQMPALRAAQGGGDKPHVLAFAWQQGDDSRHGADGRGRSWVARAGDSTGALSSSRHDAVAGGFGVRRLTPTECERLMGWEDGRTELDDQGNRLADSVRYRLIGNGVVANVTEWIARRLIAACSEGAG